MAATISTATAAHATWRPAIEMLREAFDRLTEGFNAPDLVDARALLDEAAVRPG